MRQDPYILANPPKREPIANQKTYQVAIKTKITGMSKPVDSAITYSLNITYDNHFFIFNKSNVVINGKPIPSKINEFYLKTAVPLHHIEFKGDKQGGIKTLYKHDKLLKTWQQTKRKVQYEFTGEPVTQLIKHLDTSYANKKELINTLNKDYVLQLFYRSFITDYLVYYGQSNTTYTSVGLLGAIPLTFTGASTLGLKNEQLHLQINSSLNNKHANTKQLEQYFKHNAVPFNSNDLQISQHYRTLLDYETVWINHSTFTQIVQLGNYKKEIIVTLQ